MGATVPSREVGGNAGAIQRNLSDDIEILNETSEIGGLDSTYKRLILFGLVSRNDAFLRKKKDKQLRKLKDSEIVLQSSLSDEPSQSQYRRRKLKCLQRELSFLSRCASPFADVMVAREQVLHRMSVAFHRILSQEKKTGMWYRSTVAEKAAFIERILKGQSLPKVSKEVKMGGKDIKTSKVETKSSKESKKVSSVDSKIDTSKEKKTELESNKTELESDKTKESNSNFSMDEKFVEQAVELADTLSELYGAVGLVSQPHPEQEHGMNLQMLGAIQGGNSSGRINFYQIRNQLAMASHMQARVGRSRGAEMQGFFAGLARADGVEELQDVLAQHGFPRLIEVDSRGARVPQDSRRLAALMQMLNMRPQQTRSAITQRHDSQRTQRTPRTPQTPQTPQQVSQQQEVKETKETKEAKETKESKEAKESKEIKESKDSKVQSSAPATPATPSTQTTPVTPVTPATPSTPATRPAQSTSAAAPRVQRGQSIGEEKKRAIDKKQTGKKKFDQTEADWEFRSGKLVDLLINRLVKDTKNALETLKLSKTDKVQIPVAFSSLHPCARLLWYLQLDLFKKASCKKDHTCGEVKQMMQYIKKVTKISTQLFNEARLLLKVKESEKQLDIKEEKEEKDSKYGETKSKAEKAGKEDMEDTPELVSVADAAKHILYNSITGEISSIALHVLYSSAFHPNYGCLLAQELLDSTMDLLKTLDCIVSFRQKKEEKKNEDEYLNVFKNKSNLHANPIIIESPHTYFGSEPDRVVNVPGATHLCIEFDPRCSTENRRDFLSITTPNGVPACEELHGRPDQWPRSPIIVEGDTVIFRFRAESFNNYFGYRCLVTGVYLGTEDDDSDAKQSGSNDTKKNAGKKVTKKVSTEAKGNAETKDRTESKVSTDTKDNTESKDSSEAKGSTEAKDSTEAKGRVEAKNVTDTKDSTEDNTEAKANTEAKDSTETKDNNETEDGTERKDNTDSKAENSEAKAGRASADESTGSTDMKTTNSAPNNTPPSSSVPSVENKLAAPPSSNENKESTSTTEANATSSVVASMTTNTSEIKSTSSANTATEGKATISSSEGKKSASASTDSKRKDRSGEKSESEDEDEDEDEDEEENISQSPSMWFVDLERACAFIVGRLLRTLSIGVHVSLTERKAHKWLASPLFAGGKPQIDEEKNELSSAQEFSTEDLVTNKAGSMAAKLHSHMRSLMKMQIHDRLGGEVAQKTIRQFIAICLKHLGMIPMVEDYMHHYETSKDPQLQISKEKLRKIWVRASEFHRSLSSAYSSNKMAFFSREEKMKETKEKWDEEEHAKAKALLTWEGYCKPIIERSEILLNQNPFYLASESTRALLVTPPRLTRVSSAYKPSDGGKGKIHTSLTTLYGAFEVLSSTSSKESTAPLLEEQESAIHELTELVMEFLFSPSPVSEFSRLVRIHEQRARHRIRSITLLRESLESLELHSAVVSILRAWGTPFRQYSAYPMSTVEKMAPKGSHYLRNIESSGPDLINKVHDEVTALYRMLAKNIGDGKSSDEMKALSIDAWAIDLLPHDHAFILKTGVLSSLEKLKQTKSNKLVKQMATAASRLLYVNILDCGPVLPGISTDAALNKLQIHTLERAMNDVKSGLSEMKKVLSKLEGVRLTQLQLGHNFCVKPPSVEEKVLMDVLKQSLGDNQGDYSTAGSRQGSESKPTAVAQRYIDIERHTFDMLSLICTTLGGFATKASISYLSSKPSLEFFMDILRKGTLRMQRIVLRAFRVLIPRIEPPIIHSIATKSIAKTTSQTLEDAKVGSFIQDLFLKLGEAWMTTESSKRITNPFRYRNGEAMLAHASDLLALLRTLLRGKEQKEEDTGNVTTATKWAAEVRNLVNYSLLQLPKLITTNGEMNENYLKSHPQDLPYVMASFAIIGGYNPKLVTGGRVESVRSGSVEEDAMRETGDLVYLDRSSNHCRVQFDHNTSRVVACEASKIKAIDPVPFDHNLFKLTKKHLQVFEIFTNVLGEDATKELERQRSEEKAKHMEEEKRKKKKQKKKVKCQWNCPLCTYLNDPNATFCAMCNTPRPAEPEPEEEDEEDIKEDEKKEEKVKVNALLYRHLRSLALQSLCNLLKTEESSQLLIGSSMLPALLRLAAQPTTLQSYKSVDGLRAEQDRLLELLLQSRDGVVSQSRVFKRRAKGNVLEFSPFKNLQVQLPNALDTASSRAMTFTDDELTTVIFNASKPIGAVRANHKIPNDLHAFYFEVTIEDEGVSPQLASDTSGSSEKEKKRPGWGIAVGLFRSGMLMDGVPGSRNSYAYNSTGAVISTVARVPVSKEYGEPYRTGDVIGCGWDLRRKRVYFTKNGKRVGPKGKGDTYAYENVHGFFFPIVWCENMGASVKVNFGQSKFVFNFEGSLPRHYLNQLKDSKGDKKTWKASEAEIRRRTIAGELAHMMQIYPRELCEIALERCGDDQTHAANWLIEHGHRELEIMTNNMIRASERMAESKQLEAAGVVNQGGDSKEDSDGEDLAEWLSGDGSNNPNNQRRAAAANFLDDEIERDVPLGVERKEIRREVSETENNRQAREQEHRAPEDQVEMVFDNYKIEDILPGQTIAVNPLAISIVGENSLAPGVDREHLREVAGRTGIVTNVEVNYKSVQALFSDPDRGVQYCLSLPLFSLIRPSGQWEDPCSLLVGEPWDVLGKKYLEVEQALSVRQVRNAVVSLVAQKWPKNVPFGLERLGGASAVLSTLKLTAAEMLSTVLDEKFKSADGSIPILEALRDKIIRITKMEWEAMSHHAENLPKFLGNLDDLYKSLKDGKGDDDSFLKSRKLLEGKRDKCSLIAKLLEECLLHFAQAVHHPPPVVVKKSKHPYESNFEIREEIYIPGASKLLITFDSRCHLGNDLLTRLCFYRDREYQDLISVSNGRGAQRYQSFVVPSNKVWFRFTSGHNDGLWGYKFKVKPLEFRLDDQQALQSHNFELGRWLFELFLTEMPTAVTERYIVELYDAITLYVIRSRPSNKIKGVKLLIQFLLHVHRIPKLRLSLLLGRMKQVPDLKKLKPLTKEMDAVMGSLDANRTIHSRTLQALMELLATADLVQRDFDITKKNTIEELKDSKEGKELKYSSISSNYDEKTKSIDISNIGQRRMVLIEAKYRSTVKGSNSIDVTTTLSTYINNCGSTDFLLPLALNELNKLKSFAIDPAKASDKELWMRYRIERDDYIVGKGIVTTIVKENIERVIPITAAYVDMSAIPEGEKTHSVVTSSPSIFEQVVRISRFTLQSHSVDEKETKKSEKKDGKSAKAISSMRPFSKTSVMATDEFLIEAIRLWSLEESYLSVVPAGGTGLELQQQSFYGTANPGHYCNKFTTSMWVYVTRGAPKKGAGAGRPRCILHRGYHVGSGDRGAKYSFRRMKSDVSYVQFAITLGAKSNHITVYCNGRSPSFASVTSKKEIQLKRWVHIAVSCNGHSVQVYLDGTPECRLNLPEKASSSSAPIIVGKTLPGFRVTAPQRGAVPSTGVYHALQSAECIIKDVRWYVRDLQRDDIKEIINECTVKGGKRTLKTFQLNEPVAKSCQADLRHFRAIETLAGGQQVKIDGKSGASSLDPSIWNFWHRWSPKMDSQLLRLFTEIAELEQKRRGIARRDALPSLLNISAPRVNIPKKLLQSYPLLDGMPIQCLRLRFLFIQILNIRILSVLPMVDFSQALSTWSLAHRISMLSHLIFLEIKNIAWTHILQQTATGRGHYVNINLPRAKKAQERGDKSGRKSVFFQLYLQLHFLKPSVLRTRSESRPWTVSYEGFGGQDAGGLFRDSVSAFCSELQSEWVPLFIPVPNSRDGGVGDNQEKWLPHPGSRSALHISNYAFIGKLMGCAIRSSFMLNIDLPSLVWKPLVGEPVTLGDVKGVDVISYGLIERLSKAGSVDSKIKKENYQEFVPEGFVMTGYDGKQVELKEGGIEIKPTWENRKEYLSLLLEHKLAEVRTQVAAIRKGLGTIVPIQLLPLFTWQELEMMVCGKREIDVEYLRANTTYRSPVRESDAHIKMFWEVLKEFSHDERRLFLRFVWGQSRLPYNPADFTQKFEILSCRDNSNNALPISHTCFFSVELPRYTKKLAMRNKILYAITNCQSIDTDHAAEDINWDD